MVPLGRRSLAWWRADSQRLRRNALIAIAVLLILPSDGLGIYVCPFHWLTGAICPACGLTRSMSSLLHGQLAGSWLYHPLGLPVLGWLVYVAVSGRSLPLVVQQMTPLTRNVLLIAIIAGVGLIWIIRLSLGVAW